MRFLVAAQNLMIPNDLSGTLDTFAEAAFNANAVALCKTVRWSTAKAVTHVLWRRACQRGAESAYASQFSPLAGERLQNPPDTLRIFAETIAHTVTPPARGSLAVHQNRLMRIARDQNTLWRPCVLAGLQAIGTSREADAAKHPPTQLSASSDARSFA